MLVQNLTLISPHVYFQDMQSPTPLAPWLLLSSNRLCPWVRTWQPMPPTRVIQRSLSPLAEMLMVYSKNTKPAQCLMWPFKSGTACFVFSWAEMTANVPWMPCPVHFHYIERKSVFVLKYLLYKLLGINKSLGSIHTALKRQGFKTCPCMRSEFKSRFFRVRENAIKCTVRIIIYQNQHTTHSNGCHCHTALIFDLFGM